MAEEERWMKLYIRSLALEGECECFESRRMILEDRLSLTLRQEEHDRVQAIQAIARKEMEGAERKEMEKEEGESARMQSVWRKLDQEKLEAKAQQDLAMFLVANADRSSPREQHDLIESTEAWPSCNQQDAFLSLPNGGWQKFLQAGFASCDGPLQRKDSYSCRRWMEWTSTQQRIASKQGKVFLTPVKSNPLAKPSLRPRSKQGEKVLTESNLLVRM